MGVTAATATTTERQHGIETPRRDITGDPIIELQENNRIHDSLDTQTPPNGGYGWVCAFCVFLINVHTWGVNSAWGVILDHYLSHSTFQNATRVEYSFIGGLSISCAFLVGPIVSQSERYLGFNVTLVIGAILIFVANLGASFAQQVWHLFLSQGVCFGVGMGFIYLPATAALPPWFSTRRSFSMGLATSGSGIGGLAYNLGTGAAIRALGVPMTYRVLAFCCLGANLVAALLLKPLVRANRAEQRKNTVNLKDLGRLEVLLIIVWGAATELGFITLWYSLPNYASSIGLSAKQGSIAGAILNLGLTIGRPAVGLVSDKAGRITVPTILTGMTSVLCFAVWVPAKSYGVLLLFALLVGSVCGTFWGTITPVMMEVVGPGRLPATFTLLCLAMVAPTAFAEPIALSLVHGSQYINTQVYVACMFLLGTLSVWVLRSWKCYETERKAYDEGERSFGERDFPGFFSWMGLQKLFVQGRI